MTSTVIVVIIMTIPSSGCIFKCSMQRFWTQRQRSFVVSMCS